MKYSQKFEAIKHFDKVIRANSRQGKRTDLAERTVEDSGTCDQTEQKSIENNETSVQNGQKTDEDNGTYAQIRQKSIEKPRHDTTRDKVARSLGMSTPKFGRYRSIIKLPDSLLEAITVLLDKEKISFETAYIISGKYYEDSERLLKLINKHPDMKIDLEKLKQLPHRKILDDDEFYPVSKERVREVMVPKDIVIHPVRKKDNR